MKELFNFPQKRGKNLICHPNEKIYVELNEIKINNFQELKDNNGYFIECNIPIINNDNSINIIKNIDNDAKTSLIENYKTWFDNEDDDNNEEIIDNIYVNSYNDELPMTLILSNKIETDIIINDEEKEQYELINFINNNKKNKNYIINLDIIFLGIYINKSTIINKWAIKYINIEKVKEDLNEWNKKDIENEWKFDLINFEEEVNMKINDLNKRLNDVKELYNEIINEDNVKLWEIKIHKLKSIIFKK
jgi:hypothetical protein